MVGDANNPVERQGDTRSLLHLNGGLTGMRWLLYVKIVEETFTAHLIVSFLCKSFHVELPVGNLVSLSLSLLQH